MDKKGITALNNALRPNPCFREITGLRSLKTDSGYDLIDIITNMMNKIKSMEQQVIFLTSKTKNLEEEIKNLNLGDLRDVNIEEAEDNAQLGYDADSGNWVPFNVSLEDIEDNGDNEDNEENGDNGDNEDNEDNGDNEAAENKEDLQDVEVIIQTDES